MYYCASRQKQPAAASSPPQDKPKESYPNERICPFPQCNKSCPSASSLEIHMRTHSGETEQDLYALCAKLTVMRTLRSNLCALNQCGHFITSFTHCPSLSFCRRTSIRLSHLPVSLHHESKL